MASYNRVVLMGNLTRDPELRYIPSGSAVSDITLAVNDRVKRNDQWVEETTFVDVTLWARTAEVANEYLSKGSNILVEGRLKLDRWEKDGQKHSKLRVVAEKMQMVGGRSGGGGGESHSSGSQQSDDTRPSQATASQAGASQTGTSHAEASTPSMPPADEIPF